MKRNSNESISWFFFLYFKFITQRKSNQLTSNPSPLYFPYFRHTDRHPSWLASISSCSVHAVVYVLCRVCWSVEEVQEDVKCVWRVWYLKMTRQKKTIRTASKRRNTAESYTTIYKVHFFGTHTATLIRSHPPSSFLNLQHQKNTKCDQGLQVRR